MVRRGPGRSRLGCLVTLLILAAIAYFAANVGEVYVRYWRFEDAMRQEARFSARRSDEEIANRLAAFADSAGLPEGARRVRVRRGDHSISISSDYYEHVELPGFVREFYFSPHAEWTY